MVNSKFEAIIGLEVHVQLQTESKIFSPSSTRFGGEPNTQVDPICLGLPGVLPVLNKKAVEFAIRMGLATHCTIAGRSIFARKHYFYPDLPKGYQISQYEAPLCENGYLEIELKSGESKRIGILRIHLEEDAGKSVHDEAYVGADETLVDLNRCGVPLIEIVSYPDLRAPTEAARYLEKIRQLVRYLGISDGNMAEGSLRCDANVSLRRRGEQQFGTKTELKNMNSISGVEKALTYEIDRQMRLLESGQAIEQQTLLWDAGRGVTVEMRSKEEAHDYRYFPDPDLVPLVVDPDWLAEITAAMPELPDARRERLISQYGLPEYNAGVLSAERETADYFEAVAATVADARIAGNWVMGEVMRVLNDRKIEIGEFPVAPERLGALIRLQEQGKISGPVARRIFEAMLESDKSPTELVSEQGLEQISDASVIEKAVDAVLAQHADEAVRYRQGEEKLFGFFVGQVMRQTRGKANPQQVNQILRRKLSV